MRVFLTPASVVRTASALLVVSAASSAHSIVGGTADLSTSVYQYMGKMSNGFGATPIASNWLVTAKHVSPIVGNTYTNPEGTFTIDQVINHPEADISLVRIAGTLTNYYGYMNLSAVSPVTLTGYGQLGTRKADGTGYDISSNVTGARYVTTNSIDAAGLIHFGTDTNPGPDFWAYAYDLDGMDNLGLPHSSLGSTTGVGPDGGLAGGDSGSGWFVNKGGIPVVVAVASAVGDASQITLFGTDTYNYDLGDQGYGAALGQYSAFIQNTTGVAPVPEPASMLALGLGTLTLLKRRRK